MLWALILSFATEDGSAAFRAGDMVDFPTCMFAGAAMKQKLEAEVAGLTVTWTCTRGEPA